MPPLEKILTVTMVMLYLMREGLFLRYCVILVIFCFTINNISLHNGLVTNCWNKSVLQKLTVIWKFFWSELCCGSTSSQENQLIWLSYHNLTIIFWGAIHIYRHYWKMFCISLFVLVYTWSRLLKSTVWYLVNSKGWKLFSSVVDYFTLYSVCFSQCTEFTWIMGFCDLAISLLLQYPGLNACLLRKKLI